MLARLTSKWPVRWHGKARWQHGGRQLAALREENAALQEQLHMARAREAELLRLAGQDELTGLPNRWLLRERVDQILARARRQQHAVAFLMIDLVGFKQINDNLGHAAGDELLRVVGQRLRAHVRSSDLVSRYGGDEFVIVLDDIAGSASLAQKIAEIEAHAAAPLSVGRARHVVRLSIGVARFPDDGIVLDDLLHRADLAMYKHKQRQRSALAILPSTRCDPSPDTPTRARYHE